jgi:hypothetical protein
MRRRVRAEPLRRDGGRATTAAPPSPEGSRAPDIGHRAAPADGAARRVGSLARAFALPRRVGRPRSESRTRAVVVGHALECADIILF